MCNINEDNNLVQSKLSRKFEKVVVTRAGKTIECGRWQELQKLINNS